MRFLILFYCSFLFSSEFDFKLKPIKLNENSYYFYGKEEYFSSKNGADIANSAFIITKNSVILIDTGSSALCGEQIKNAISKITSKPIKYIINTHHHPDHFLGNSAFKNSNIYATNFTKNEIEKNGQLYISNLVNLVGEVMNKTEVNTPNEILTTKELIIDNYKLKILFFNGHTKSDIIIFDENTNILYTSDLVFNKRTPATPHANISEWINSLESLKKLNSKIIIPGHGIAFKDKKPIDENIDYLRFLDKTFKDSAKKRLDIYEVLNTPIPKEFKNFTMFKEEFEKSVINLYPLYENGLE